MSKESDEIQEFASDNGWDSIPGQWWNMLNAARNWIEENLVEGRVAGEILVSLVEASFERNVFGHVC